ncbi:MAG: hypothetical protein K2I37_07255 [Muribaculaceae bacterium]|nr:hypothetical protein [Muribaculaceae bacterium]
MKTKISTIISIFAMLMANAIFSTAHAANEKVAVKDLIVCVAGDFNNWQLPTKDSDNGAYLLALETTQYGHNYFIGKVSLPQGDSEFSVFGLHPNTYELIRKSDTTFPNFELMNASGHNDYPLEWKNYDRRYDIFQKDFIDIWISRDLSFNINNSKDTTPFRILNWGGGELELKFGAEAAIDFISFKSDNAPVYAPIVENNVLYAIVECDNAPAQIIELPFYRTDKYMTAVSLSGTTKSTIIFSTEKSLTPAPENTWGCSTRNNVEYTMSKVHSPKNVYMDLVRGGQPYEVTLNDVGIIAYYTDWVSKQVQIYAYYDTRRTGPVTARINIDGKEEYSKPLEVDPATGFYPPISAEGKNVSILFQYDIYDNDGKLRSVASYGYTDDPYRQLPTDERYPDYSYDKFKTYGSEPFSASFKECGTMTMELSPVYGICYCHYDGELDQSAAEIDNILPELSEESPSDSNVTEYFDLMGRRLPGPQKGIYLEKRDNKVRKVMNY